MIIKISLLVLVIFSVANLANAQQSACSSEEYRQFDFWIGEWEVKNSNDQVVGTSKVELILNDCVIFENWQSANPGYAGKSFNYYNRATQKWNQKWIDTNASPIEFEGSYDEEEEALYYTAITTNREGLEVLNKMTFYKSSEDYVNQLWEQSSDEGKTWTTVFDGHYRRKK